MLQSTLTLIKMTAVSINDGQGLLSNLHVCNWMFNALNYHKKTVLQLLWGMHTKTDLQVLINEFNWYLFVFRIFEWIEDKLNCIWFLIKQKISDVIIFYIWFKKKRKFFLNFSVSHWVSHSCCFLTVFFQVLVFWLLHFSMLLLSLWKRFLITQRLHWHFFSDETITVVFIFHAKKFVVYILF